MCLHYFVFNRANRMWVCQNCHEERSPFTPWPHDDDRDLSDRLYGGEN